MKRILVVDDSAALRGSVCALGPRNFPGRSSAKRRARSLRLPLSPSSTGIWSCSIFLSLPDWGGVEALRELRTLRPNLPVVVMSLHAEAEYRAAMRAAGAVDYISKGSSARFIAAAIRTVLGNS